MRLFSNSTKRQPARPEAAPSPPSRSDALSKVLDRNGRWVEVADAKAGVILVFTTAVLKELVAPSIRTMRALGTTFTPPLATRTGVVAWIFLILLLLVATTAVLALFYAFRVLSPRTQRKRPPGHIFFADVARQDFATYEREMQAISMAELEQEVIEQIYSIADVAQVKHRYVRRAVVSVFLVIPLGLLLYVLSLYVA
jgi:hypothetical protein